MFTNYSLKTKIMAICMVLASIAAVTGGIGFVALRDVAEEYAHVAAVNLPNSQILGDMRAHYISARVALRTFGMEGLTPELMDKAEKSLLQEIEGYEEADKRYQSIDFVAGEQALYDPLNAEWKEYKQAALKILEIARKTDPASRQAMQTFYFKTAVGNTQRFNAAMDKLIQFQTDQSQQWVAQAEKARMWGDRLILLSTIGGFIVALFSGITFSTALTRQLRKTAENLSAGADDVASAATEISSTSELLSSSATEQASAIQETAASVEEMNAMVKKNSENANRSVEVAKSSQGSATRGKQVVQEMISAIDDISVSNAEIMRQIEASNGEITNIVKVIAEIGNKTKVINDIVFQTKLLSFNASVEAARAGEHGKGFAVVAEEVGNLAQMSGNAAKEISAMLDDSIKKVEQTVTTTKSSVEGLVAKGKVKVDSGTTIARRCGEVLEELVNDVGRVSNMVSEISSASTEQTTGLQEISKAMRQLDQVTQQNTSASHQSAAASEQLAKQAGTLQATVQELLQAVNGAGKEQSQVSRRTTPKAEAKVVNLKPAQAPVSIEAGDGLPSQFDERFKSA